MGNEFDPGGFRFGTLTRESQAGMQNDPDAAIKQYTPGAQHCGCGMKPDPWNFSGYRFHYCPWHLTQALQMQNVYKP